MADIPDRFKGHILLVCDPSGIARRVLVANDVTEEEAAQIKSALKPTQFYMNGEDACVPFNIAIPNAGSKPTLK